MAAPHLTPGASRKLLIASADERFRANVAGKLRPANWKLEEACGGADALARLDSGRSYEALVLDESLPDLSIEELEKIVGVAHPEIDVFVLDKDTGAPIPAAHPLRYPRSQQLLWLLREDVAEERAPLRYPPQKAEASRATIPLPAALMEPLPGVIGSSAEMCHIAKLVRLVAARKTTVLITGESGTGKELIAKAVHRLSPRANRPLVVVNCAAIPEALLESELFGFARGAFTGAYQAKPGRIQFANGGTLFLDEIGELPLLMQAKLLRFLQEGEVQRLGGMEPEMADVRIVTATNANLEMPSSEKPFRQDLYFRLSTFPITVPALRRRPGDIAELARHQLSVLEKVGGFPALQLTDGALSILEHHVWPGNVRELQNVMERAAILADGESSNVIDTRHLTQLSGDHI